MTPPLNNPGYACDRPILSAILLFREFQKGFSTLASAASVSISFVFFVSSAAATVTARTAFPWLSEDAFESIICKQRDKLRVGLTAFFNR